MLDTEMLIGSKFVAGTEAPEAVINPKTEETIVKLPDASTAQVDAGGGCGDEGLPDLVAHHAGRALGPAVEARRRHRCARPKPSPRSKR